MPVFVLAFWGLLLLSPSMATAQDSAPIPPVTYLPSDSETIPPALSTAPISPGRTPLGTVKGIGGTSPSLGLGPVTEAAALQQLDFIKNNNDTLRRLDWVIGQEASGRGLIADEQGRLRSLNLENQALVGLLSLKGLAGLAELRSYKNPLSDLELVDLPELKKITVSGSDMEVVSKKCFSGLAALNELDLKSNRLRELEGQALRAMPELLTLNLSGNFLPRLGRHSFSGLEKLSELHLGRNQLSEIEWGTFSPLKSLVTLQLSGNRLSAAENGLFQGLNALELLLLDDNRLNRVGREAFKGLTKLKYLDLAGNQLTDIHPDTFKDQENLDELDLEGNHLSLGTMAELRRRLRPETYVYFREQKDVYFAIRVQYLPLNDHYLVPEADAYINRVASHGDVMGDGPRGARYSPAANDGQPGRVDFQQPGVYQLTLTNSALGADPDASSRTGYFIVVDRCPTIEEAVAVLGSRALAGRLIQDLNRRGYVEAPASNPKMVSALKALFELR